MRVNEITNNTDLNDLKDNSRAEADLVEMVKKLYGEAGGTLPVPKSRMEFLLHAIYEKLGEGGGGGSVDPADIETVVRAWFEEHSEAVATGFNVEFVDDGIEFTNDQMSVEEAVAEYLDDHPEATTTVRDGAISYAKLDSNLKAKADDVSELKSDLEQLAENGYYSGGADKEYIPTQYGRIRNGSPATVQEMADISYVKLTNVEESAALYFDNTLYKINFAYFKNDVKQAYTTWVTTSPAYVDPTVSHDEVYVNVSKLSGNMTDSEILTCLYYYASSEVGNLATKEYAVAKQQNMEDAGKILGIGSDGKITPIAPLDTIKEGKICIYPDGFTSRIKPDIYFNGKYYADIDIENYKISGTGEVWVALDGDDTTGDGTENNPYATITKALTQNIPTIKIKSGTYIQGTHYATNVDFSGKNIIGVGRVTLQNDSSGHYCKANTNAYIENIVFKHGNATTNSSFVTNTTTSGQTICFVDCTFCDGGANGLSAKGSDVICVRCVAYGNKLDGLNYHDNSSGENVYIPNVLEIDCKAYNNGTSESGSDSCNGSTAHDGVKIIRLNGEYYSCYGGVIAEIARTGEEPTISVNYGVLAHDSTGTSDYKASFWASINTQMYLYDCQSYGGDYDISAINDAKVVSWRLTTGRDNPSVNAASTATVIQH